MNQANVSRLFTLAKTGQPNGYAGSEMMQADLEAVLKALTEEPPVVPQGEWVDLDVIDEVNRIDSETLYGLTTVEIVNAVIAKFKEKNTPPVVPQGDLVAWIDPNDKTQAQYLPHIGEKVLFCHDGVTYFGNHTGGCFRTGLGITSKDFNTWECHWMYPPAAAIMGMKDGVSQIDLETEVRADIDRQLNALANETLISSYEKKK